MLQTIAVLTPTLDRLPAAMMLVDSRGRIEHANPHAERTLASAPGGLIGRSVDELVPQRFRGGHHLNRESFLREPQARPMGFGRELFAVRGDGIEIPVEIGLNPLETDRGPMVLAVIVDITQRKSLEHRFERVVEYSPNAMVMIDARGRIAMVNAAAEQLFGYAREEMLGHSVEMLVPGRYRGAHPGFREGYFSNPGARPMGAGRELYAVRKDGTEVPVEIGLNPIETDEGPMVLSAIVDISDRRQREESVRRALEEKELLLGEIHHRVKNNLQMIHSLLDLQAMHVEDPRALAMLKDSQNRVRSMSLIHQTLYQSHDFARVDFGYFLETLANVLVDSYADSRTRIALRLDATQISLPMGVAIPCGLILNELVSNAIKHGFPDGRTGSILVSVKGGEDDDFVLEVANDGVPLPPEAKVEAASTLGLVLVNLLTKQLHGELEAQRDPVRFRIRFPGTAP
ncbi:hypothetical protein BWI17_11665 [Betaproteobacteria bacterium GR16-43]|nr:hypothetical protein BWI17_11665 [Betaproteobacteria bacterium GR16-43]